MADICVFLAETSFEDVSIVKAARNDFFAIDKLLAPPICGKRAVRAGPNLIFLVPNAGSIKEGTKSLEKEIRRVNISKDMFLDIRKLIYC